MFGNIWFGNPLCPQLEFFKQNVKSRYSVIPGLRLGDIYECVIKGIVSQDLKRLQWILYDRSEEYRIARAYF